MDRNSNKKQVILLGCFGEDTKWGGTKTFVNSLKFFLKSQGYTYVNVPKSQNANSSYMSLLKIKLDSMKLKLPTSSVVIAQRPDELFMFKLFNKKIKSICLMHSDNLRKMKLKKNNFVARLYQFMEKKGLEYADKIVCVDKSTYDIHVARYPDNKNKTVIIPVGVNTTIFKPTDRTKSRQKLGISEELKVMLVAARLEKEKNLSAIVKLIQTNFDNQKYCLLIAGKGKEESMLKELASNVKKAKIMFLDQVPYTDLPKVISASDVVLVPSLFESGPLIIIEAMACGVPTISTNVGRASTFIDNSGCGAVVDEVNEVFALKIKEFLEPEKTVKELCMERVKMFSFDNTGKEMIKLIEDLR